MFKQSACNVREEEYNLSMINTPAASLFATLAADVRKASDARLDETVALLGGWASLASSPAVYRIFEAEAARRAETRLNRGEYGQFDASWYESRPVRSCSDCGHSAHDERDYQFCGFNASLAPSYGCNCQNIPMEVLA